MNGLIYIEKARVCKCGEYARVGRVGGNGADRKRQRNGEEFGRCQQLAVWARDNVKEGSEFNGVPFMHLNLWVRAWGRFEAVKRADGTAWLKETNSLTVESVNLWEEKPATAPGFNIR